MPSAPCTWMARSSTRSSTPATKNLMSEICSRASYSPFWSMVQAARSTIRRAASISARLSAIHACTICLVPSALPGWICRAAARAHMSSKARSQMPIQRMQWWMRPGPSRSCAMRKPAPSLPSRLATGTRTLV
jgi:hypothetical protein